MRSKIVVAGSLHYDIFVEAERRPVKGETLQGKRWYPKFGGKGGNQAVAAARAGCKVLMVSAVGADQMADYVMQRLKAEGVDTSRVPVVTSAGTGMSVAIADKDGDYGAVIVSGANCEVQAEVFADATLWDDAGMLILQNEMPESTNLAAARAAHGRGVPVCLNAAPVRESSDELKQLIDLLVVNQVEAEGFCGKKVADLEAALQAARELLERFPQVVVTAGGSGVAYAARRGDSGTLPAHRVKVISTHGAGDCFVGHLCAALVRGAGLSEAVAQANEASARHVSTPQVS